MSILYETLVAWYKENKRDLPWRRSRDPYHIWVSEIMLQQTRVEAVIPYYERFIEAFPTIVSLSEASDDMVNKYWEGLGYYSRVRNMKKAAIICREKYGGQFPENYEEMLALPGIGPYTAGAIASIAFNQKVCAIDGNVLRVYARYYCIEDDILKESTRKKVQALMELDKGEDMSSFIQALMDFGSSICIAGGQTRCNICPLKDTCKAYKEGRENVLPIRQKIKKRKKEKHTVLVYTYKDEVLIHKRENTGLLAGLYEFVLEDGHLTKKDTHGLYLGKYKHVFSHIEWDMKGFLIELDEKIEKEGYMFVPVSSLETTYSIPTAFKYYKEKLYEVKNKK